MYDVIVAGAGSAGCTASKVLAEKGYKVLLVEKFRISYMQYQWSLVGGMAGTFKDVNDRGDGFIQLWLTTHKTQKSMV